MVTTLIFVQLLLVLTLIFVGARVGGIGLGITGMLGVFILVYGFGLQPGKLPIDVMLIIVSVITAAASLQAAGGLDYLVGVAARFLRRHPDHITYYGPLTCWLFCIVAGTAHTCYSLLPIIAEIAKNNKVRPERPLSVSVIAASLGITGSPVSAATAAIISTDLLGGRGIELKDILIVCIPASIISIIAAAFVQNKIGKELEQDPIYQKRLAEGLVNTTTTEEQRMTPEKEKYARRSVFAFLFGVFLVILFGSVPSLRPSFEMADGTIKQVSMSETIEMVMMSAAAFILLLGKANVKAAASGSVFGAGMNAMVSIFGIAWMGDTYFSGHLDFFSAHISTIVTQMPMLFAVALFFMSIMLFSQAATVRTLYPLGVALGINPMLLIAMFPACNGYFFLPNYPTEVAALNFDDTGTTRVGKYVINHSFQASGFITTIVSIAVGYLIVLLLY
ncbi:MAG: anaerobic C4-dicarboxylate transporter [Prevotellaceae bacterium]|nr:anaerobic C4-dicarboxylate transporter [Prevotellaceae bacterium]